MRASSSLAAIALSVFTFTGTPGFATAAHAADLDGEAYVEPPYDDSGYADESGGPDEYAPSREYGARQGYSAAREYNAPREYGAAEPLPGSIKDGYPVPMPPPRYSEERTYQRVERIERRSERHGCLARWEIRRSLNRDGWVDIRPMGGDGATVRIRATRFDSGRMFNLRVDKCSGEVIAARPHFLRSYAYRDRPWR
jgi:hypothetical protein